MEQLSVATSDEAIFGITSSQSLTVTLDGQVVILGAITSRTVTVATQTLVFPAESLTVSVILLSPRFEQVYDVEAGVRISAAGLVQLSDDPPFIWAAVTVAAPEADRFTVMF
jgi:hypothetical protein